MSVVSFHVPLSIEQARVFAEAFGRAVTYRDLYDVFVGVLGPHWLLPADNEAEVRLYIGRPQGNTEYQAIPSEWAEKLPPGVIVPEYLERLGVSEGLPRIDMLQLMEVFAQQVMARLDSVVVPEALQFFADKPTLSDIMTATLSRLLNVNLERAVGALQNELRNPCVFSAEVKHILARGGKKMFYPTQRIGVPMARILTVISMLRRAEETAMPGISKSVNMLQRQATAEEEARRRRMRTVETAKEVRDRKATGQRSIARTLLRTGLAAEEARSRPAMWLEVCERAKELLAAGKMKDDEREYAVRMEACRAALGVLLGFTAGDRENDVLFDDTGFVSRGLAAVERMDRDLLLDTAWTLVMLRVGSYPRDLLGVDVFAGKVSAEVMMRMYNNNAPLRRTDETAIEVALEAGVMIEEASNIISTCIEKVAEAQDTHATSEKLSGGEMVTAGITAAIAARALVYAISAQAQAQDDIDADDLQLRMAAVAGGVAAVMMLDEDQQEDAAVDYVARGLRSAERGETARPLVDEAIQFARGRARRSEAGGVNALVLPPWMVMLKFMWEI